MSTLFIITFLFAAILGLSQTSSNGTDFKTLPEKWVMLTETDSGLVIYNSCSAGNRLLSLIDNNGDNELLLHGLQEDFLFEVINTHELEEEILVETKWKNSDKNQFFKFKWVDAKNGLGIWETQFFNNQTTQIKFVTFDRQLDFPIIDQPCKECWDDECDYLPIEIIKRIFNKYVKYNESTDSPDNKDMMSKSLENLSVIENPNKIELLLNVWMYYDPTDWDGKKIITKIFRQNKDLSLLVINKRIENPMAWENKDSAPLTDLKYLISELNE